MVGYEIVMSLSRISHTHKDQRPHVLSHTQNLAYNERARHTEHEGTIWELHCMGTEEHWTRE